MLETVILLTTVAIVYALAWALARVIEKGVPVPDCLRPGLPWLLFQLYLVGGLFLTGDLPGAPRAVVRFLGLAAALSLALGAATLIRRRTAPATHLGSWMLAGVLPWAVALAVEFVSPAASP